MTQVDPNVDPLDAAMDAEAPLSIRTVFGEVQVDTWWCALVKGEGKVPFDPAVHSTDARRVAIDMTIIPTKGDYNVKREIIAESNDWAKIIKPSLRALNIDLRAINGRFVQLQMVPAGKYTDKNTGETKERTMPKFVAIYPGLDECLAAADEFFNKPSSGSSAIAPAPAPTAPAPNGNGNPAERETAKKFLPALYKSAGGDVSKLAELLANNPLTKKYFDISSPEVVALVQQQAA